VYAGAACVHARDADAIAESIERSLPEGALVCFSVRSAFDLLLTALDLENGSEVLMSAITHPDMARIVERHRLVPVPVDLDLDTLEPRPDLLGSALTARSRMLVVAHLFGSRSRLDAAVAFCRRHGLLLVEDCAQALRAPDDLGDERADASLFSFGSIKTAPALGGAVAYVRDPALLERMRKTQQGWPLQRRGTYAGRVVRFAGLLALGHPVVYEGFVRGGRRAGLDVDTLVNRSVHALKPPSADDGDDFGEWLHRRPSAPLLALLRRRLMTFDRERLRRRAERGERAARALPKGILQPGRDTPVRSHWVFPVACDEPERLIEALRAQGFDATAATSSIASIAPPAGRTDLDPRAASHLMERVVFVPVYPELPERAFTRLLDVLGRPESYGLPSAGSASYSSSRATVTPSSRSARSRSSR
jgi:dTDP-4-amino-4,6-dideoxygalactose transaminase